MVRQNFFPQLREVSRKCSCISSYHTQQLGKGVSTQALQGSVLPVRAYTAKDRVFIYLFTCLLIY